MTKGVLFSGGLTLLAACSAVAQEGQPLGLATFMWRPLPEAMKPLLDQRCS